MVADGHLVIIGIEILLLDGHSASRIRGKRADGNYRQRRKAIPPAGSKG
jgi:hypothetical protein